MKEFILFSVLALFATKTFGQQIDSSSAKPNVDYLKKSKKQKTAAWVLTSAGTVGLLGTLTADMRQVAGGGLITIFTLGTVEPEYKSYTGYYLLSTAVLGAGIGYFIATSKNKKKAIESSAFIRMEKRTWNATNNDKKPNVPCSGCQIKFISKVKQVEQEIKQTNKKI